MAQFNGTEKGQQAETYTGRERFNVAKTAFICSLGSRWRNVKQHSTVTSKSTKEHAPWWKAYRNKTQE